MSLIPRGFNPSEGQFREEVRRVVQVPLWC